MNHRVFLFLLGALSAFPNAQGSYTKISASKWLKRDLGDSFLSRNDWSENLPQYDKLLANGDIENEDAKDLISLHHTVTGEKFAKDLLIPASNEKSAMEAIVDLHTNRFNFADIGYHFVVSQSGKIYEGRPLYLLGSHTGGLNQKNIGVAFLGCFSAEGCKQEERNITKVTEQMIDAAAALFASINKNLGISLDSNSVLGRTDLEKLKKKETKFLFSPGTEVAKKIPEMLAKAQKIRNSNKS